MSSETWSESKFRGGGDERLSCAAAGCFSISALIVASLSATGLSSEDNSLNASLMLPSSILNVMEADRAANSFLTRGLRNCLIVVVGS